jgi:hypothetical protein
MINVNKKSQQKGGAMIGTVFLMAAIGLASTMALLQKVEHTKRQQVQAMKKKTFELIIDNLKAKLSNPHVCSSAFRGKSLNQIFNSIDPLTGELISLLEKPLNIQQNSQQVAFNSNQGVYIGGLINERYLIAPAEIIYFPEYIAPVVTGTAPVIPVTTLLPGVDLDRTLPGLDISLIQFEEMRFNIENNRPAEIYPNMAPTPGRTGVFYRTGAESLISPAEVQVQRFKANVNITANIGLLDSESIVLTTNGVNDMTGNFTTDYQWLPSETAPNRRLYPRKIYSRAGLVLRQVAKGNPHSGYVYQWTENQLAQMGVTMVKQSMEIPLYFYQGADGLIKDCFSENSTARTCELNGGLWRTANPAGYECEPRIKCLTSAVVYAATDAQAIASCPAPFKSPLRVGVAMNANGSVYDLTRISFLCRWCGHGNNRY